MLFVLFSTISILHCLAVHEPDCRSKWSTPLISMSLLLKHLYFVSSLYVCISALLIFSTSFMAFCLFINDRGEPVSASHWNFSVFVVVSTQNSPFVCLLICSFVCWTNLVGWIRLMLAQSSWSSFMYRAASASMLSSVESSCCSSCFTCLIHRVWGVAFWPGVVRC